MAGEKWVGIGLVHRYTNWASKRIVELYMPLFISYIYTTTMSYIWGLLKILMPFVQLCAKTTQAYSTIFLDIREDREVQQYIRFALIFFP